MPEYAHVACGTEIMIAAVMFKVTAEGCLAYGDRKLLYVEGRTTAGSACCGAIECRLIHVPGFVVSWHDKTDDVSGSPLSKVEPITDPATLEDVKKLLFKTFPSSLFLFAQV